MKKLFIIFTLLFLVNQAAFAQNMTCSAAMKAKKPFVVLYTADYCTYCRRFKPIYSEVSQKYNQKYNFVTIDVAKKSSNGECDKLNITSIPSLYVFNPKNGDRILMPQYLYYKTHLIENELDKYYASLN